MKIRIVGLISVASILALSGAVVRGDAVGYSGVRDIQAETDAVRAEHHHDWSSATREARWKMISTTKNPFTAENTYAYLRLIDKASGREIFRKPVPALTDLWISPDSRYVVGLSALKLNNPYQLVVFNRSGDRLFEKSITSATWPSVQESETNAVEWFREPPELHLEESGGWVTLSIVDRLGKTRSFRFRSTR